DADQFRLENSLNSDATLNSTFPYPEATFGLGSRIRPVRIFVENALWLSVASLLACFNLDKVLNEDSVEIELLKLRLH
ncbi:hypothetical protein BT96DRAFT_818636, partial [Gymnopus androsaceus JB14]